MLIRAGSSARAISRLGSRIPRSRLPLEFRSPRDQIANHIICIVIGNAEVRHVYVAVFLSQRYGGRVFLRQQLLGMLDLAHQPVAVACVRYARKIGTNFVSLSHGMAAPHFLVKRYCPGSR
jgi:hypothetical protein